MKNRTLSALLVAFFVASLIHFIHNAEFLADYPGLPKTWTRGGVYGAWAAMTAIGVVGWIVARTRFQLLGLAFIAVCSLFGFDSIGHYFVAPVAAHSMAMNVTILLEVACAIALFCYTAWLFVSTFRARSPNKNLIS
jgi:hypothetical protein